MDEISSSQECLLLDKTITNITFSPLLLHGHKWPNYKKRLAIWKNTFKAYKISEMHIGALVAISMTDSCKLVRADGGEMAEGRSSRFNNYLVIKLKNLLLV